MPGPQDGAPRKDFGVWGQVGRAIARGMAKRSTVGAALAQAAAAVDEKDALAALLAAWRECPAVALAELIEARGKTAAATLHQPIGGKTLEARQAAWLTAAAKREATQLDRLIESLFERTIAPTTARVEALARWGPDPRLGRVVLRWREQGTFSSSQSFWSAMLALARSCGDPRVVAALRPPERRGPVHPEWTATMAEWERAYEELGADPNRPVDGKRPLSWAHAVFESADFAPEVAALLVERGARADNETVTYCIIGNTDDDVALLRAVLDRLDEPLDKRAALAVAVERRRRQLAAMLRAR